MTGLIGDIVLWSSGFFLGIIIGQNIFARLAKEMRSLINRLDGKP